MYGNNQIENLTKLPPEDLVIRAQLQSSLLKFTGTFFKELTGRDYIIPRPEGMQSHVVQICNALTDVHNLKCKRLMIHVPPRAGKSYFTASFVAYALGINPMCNFIYSSYGYDLVIKLTSTIRDILMLKNYRHFFGVELSRDTNSKDWFKTKDGGELMGAGAGGPILGNGAGIRGCKDQFSGAFIIDDAHNPDKKIISKKESDEMLDWYIMKVLPRLNGADVPIIIICHKLGKNDLPGRIMEISKPDEWNVIKIPALYDNYTKSFYPEEYPVEMLLDYKERFPFMFYSMMQQEPLSESTSLFKEESFEILSEDPDIMFTFITVDTAETDKTYNDPTVFGFFGVYKLKHMEDTYAIHWIDCEQMWIEPKDLQSAFMAFYASCCRYKVKPSFVAIEKKNTGVTLLSVLKSYQGIEVVDVERTSASGSKITRFISMQPYINKRLVSFTKYARHYKMCVEHLTKITPDGTYAHDDIADILFDSIKLGLMENTMRDRFGKGHAGKADELVKNFASEFMNIQRLKDARY